MKFALAALAEITKAYAKTKIMAKEEPALASRGKDDMIRVVLPQFRHDKRTYRYP